MLCVFNVKLKSEFIFSFIKSNRVEMSGLRIFLYLHQII
ncbi:MAG: hypothetical protein ACI94Y_000952 [Maribacter sp.]|jgi:hypothetical protein